MEDERVPESLESVQLRQEEARAINAAASARSILAALHGRVWAPDEVADEFELLEFKAPFVVARRRRDGVLGSLKFQHHPRFYFAWETDTRG